MKPILFLDLETDPRVKFAAHVDKYGIRYRVLADELNCSRNQIKEILKCRQKLKEKDRERLNELFGTDY